MALREMRGTTVSKRLKSIEATTNNGGGKGPSKGDAKKHRKMLRNDIKEIDKPFIRRLARRGGVKRISGLIYEEAFGKRVSRRGERKETRKKYGSTIP